jgi:signal transduction histidine kinase
LKLGIRAKLFLISIGLIALALTIGYGYLRPAVDHALVRRISSDLEVRLDLAAHIAEQADIQADDTVKWTELSQTLMRLCRARVTLLDATGKVLADSDVEQEALPRLENHQDRPEIISAWKTGRGVSTRYSQTLGKRMHYVAAVWNRKRGGGRAVVRLALPLVEVDRALFQLHLSFAIAAVLALSVASAMSSFAAHFAARSVRNLTITAHRMVHGELKDGANPLDQDEVATLSRDLDELAERMRRLESLRRDFVANVSHELRTPVTALRSAAETLRVAAVRDPAAAQRFLDIIERNAVRLHHMVEDLLDLSRIESQKLKLHPIALRLPEFAEHMLEMFKLRAEEKHIRLSMDIKDELPEVRADSRALEQVLVNLLDNAIKYCPAGARVTLCAEAWSKKRVRVVVVDTGPGIEARHLPRLFERFYRVDAGRSRELGGTGLGLAIVKHLVEAMQGEVDVESEVGSGSSFRFTLPCAPPASAD